MWHWVNNISCDAISKYQEWCLLFSNFHNHHLASIIELILLKFIQVMFWGRLLWKYWFDGNLYYFVIIVRTFEIYRASHMTKNSRYSCAKISTLIDLKPSAYVLSSSHNKYRQYQVQSYSNSGTWKFSIFGHVTCPANSKCADYSLFCF